MSGGSRVRLVKALTFSAETGAIVKHCFATTLLPNDYESGEETGFP